MSSAGAKRKKNSGGVNASVNNAGATGGISNKRPAVPGAVNSSSSSSIIGHPISASSRVLQERLHELLSKLASTLDVVKNWPSSTTDERGESVHSEQTTKLIVSIQQLIARLTRVEELVRDNGDVRKLLQDCPIPLDLLDLLDHGGFMHPDFFVRGLLTEAIGQLGGLKRRKLALEMLGAAVQAGINRKKHQQVLDDLDKEQETKQNEERKS
jgi:hypothetical protein